MKKRNLIETQHEEPVKPTKKLHKNMKFISSVAVLLGICLVGGISFANSSGAGSQTDPLITLSYLQETLTPTLMQEAQIQAKSTSVGLQQALDQQIEALKEELTGVQMGQFELVSLSQGQQLALGLGTQVVLRIGSVTVDASSSPALVNLTTGTTIESGSSLVINHLFLSSISGRTLTATENSVKLLVYGEYTFV